MFHSPNYNYRAGLYYAALPKRKEIFMTKMITLNNVEIISSSLFNKDFYGKKFYAKIALKDAITEFDKAVDKVLAAYCENNKLKICKSDLLYNQKDGTVSVSSYNRPMVFEGEDTMTPIYNSTEDFSGRTAKIICEIGIYEHEDDIGISKDLKSIIIHDSTDPVEKMLRDMRKKYEGARNPKPCQNELSDILKND